METNDIVMLSRIRLARNLDNLPFCNNTNLEDGNIVLKKCFDAISLLNSFNLFKCNALPIDTMEEYLEDHIISSELIENSDISGVAISFDKTVSIMINEEDHLREQCILKGLNLKRAYDIINDIDNDLNESLHFAFDKTLGYKTACTTNVGTGIRASVLMFLPGICLTNNLNDMMNAVSKLGICVRGTYGEGSGANGYTFQISNQFSLGKTEQELIQLVESTVLKICDLENKARLSLLESDATKLKDDVLRAYGILSSCYKISSTEATNLLSKVKLGISLKIIFLKDSNVIEDLLNSISAIKIKKLCNKNLNDENRDIYRAEYLARVLKNLKI